MTSFLMNLSEDWTNNPEENAALASGAYKQIPVFNTFYNHSVDEAVFFQMRYVLSKRPAAVIYSGNKFKKAKRHQRVFIS